MGNSHTITTCAAGKIELAVRRLSTKYPFHARVLERFQVTAKPEVGTMAVTVSGDRVLLLHNPQFVMATPAVQLVGVLLHEVHHVVFDHILADPADYPDRWARTVAEEITVNEFVHEPLPAGVITLSQFPGLAPLESTDERYAQLKQAILRGRIGSPADLSGSAGQGSVPGDAHGRTKVPAKEPALGNTVDDHSIWQEAHADRHRSEAAIRDVLYGAAHEAGLDQVPSALRSALEHQGIGSEPGGSRSELAGGHASQLNWRNLLRRYVGQAVEVRPVFNRPPRRFPALVGIIPGRRHQAAKPKIMAVIDTSGSITQEHLEMINAELEQMARQHTVIVVECDAAIQRTYPFRRLDGVSGQGGTDFRPPFEPSFVKSIRPDLLIFFTDGEGPAPAKAPPLPVIWCLVPGGKRPAGWGLVVEMNENR